MTVKAAIYARFSSDNQRDESIDAQIRAAEDYAKRNNMQVVKIYTDRAKSATSDKRPEFQRMIADSAGKLFDVVIVHKLDRFSRDRHDSAYYRRKLKKNKVKLVSVIENLDGSPESIILESLLEGMAEYYSKNLAREVIKGLRESAYQCRHTGGTPPLGYDVDPVTRKYIINEREAQAVRLIFRLYVDGYGYDRIITELNDRGYRTKKNKPFGRNSLHDILANEKYSGTYVFNRAGAKDEDGKRNNHGAKSDDEVIRIPGGVPAIVDPEVFRQAQEKMQKNKRQPGAYKAKETYLLSGLIVCGECLKREGRTYAMMGNAKFSGRDKRKHVTYRCGNRERTKECDNKELRREYIEAYVLAELERRVFNEQAIPYLVERLNEYQKLMNGERNQEREQLIASLHEVNTEIKNIVGAIAKGIASDSLMQELAGLEERKAALETSIREISMKDEAKPVTEEMLRGLFGMFRQFVAERNLPEIKKFIGSYVEKVIVYKDHVDVVFSIGAAILFIEQPFRFTVSVTRRKLLRGLGKAA